MSHLNDSQLFTYIDDELTSAEKRPLAAHLATCPACAAKLIEWQALFGEMETLPIVPLTIDLSENVVELLTAETTLATSPAIHWLGIIELILAALALIFGWPFIQQTVKKMGVLVEMGLNSAETNLTLPLLNLFTQTQSTFNTLTASPISLTLSLILLTTALLIWLAITRLTLNNLHPQP